MKHRQVRAFRLPRLSLRHRIARHRAETGTNRPRRQRIVVAVTIGTLSVSGAVLLSEFSPPLSRSTSIPVTTMDLARTGDNRVSRDRDRTAPSPVTSSPSASPSAPASPSPSGSASPSASPSPTKPQPVAGLDQAQTDNAAVIVKVAAQRGLPTRAMVIAIATALQESNLYNYANSAVPESLNYPHQRVGSDHDSVGLFQQRPSSGWGAVSQLMDPAYAAGAFYNRLVQIAGWQSMQLTWAAQAVQQSAFPYAYQQHEAQAQQIVNALA